MLHKLKHTCCAAALAVLSLGSPAAENDSSAQAILDSIMAVTQMEEGTLPLVQEEIKPDDYYQKDFHQQQFDEQEWKAITEDMDYTEAKEKPKEKKKSNSTGWSYRPPSGSWFQLNSTFWQVVLFAVIIAVLAFVMYKLMTGKTFIRNTKVEKPKTFRIEDVEDAIHESDLERFLREALESGEYRLAVRIYYLMVIKELSERSWIKWKKEKTNNDYLVEMGSHEEFPMFRDITRLFEYAWYGEMEVKEKQYGHISPHFRDFLNKIKTAQPR